MKKILTIVTCLIVAVSVYAGTQDFALVNHSGTVIQYLYVKKNSTGPGGAWGDDILGSDVLGNRQKLPISFEGQQECNWDVRVKFADGKIYDFLNQNLCTISTIEVTAQHYATNSGGSGRPISAGRPTTVSGTSSGQPRVEGILSASDTSFSPSGKDFSVINRTGATIMYLYISPVSSDGWGEDILGSSTTLGNEMRANIRMGDVSECNWDVKVKDNNEKTYTFRNQNLCQLSDLVVTSANKD